MKRKTIDTEISGTVVKAEIEEVQTYGRDYGNERRAYILSLAIQTESDVVYCKAGRIERTITSGGGVAVVLYSVENGQNNGFFAVSDGDSVAVAGRPNQNALTALIQSGDKVVLNGRLKASTVSKKGNPYRVITHVKLIHCDSTERIQKEQTERETKDQIKSSEIDRAKRLASNHSADTGANANELIKKWNQDQKMQHVLNSALGSMFDSETKANGIAWQFPNDAKEAFINEYTKLAFK